MVEERKTKDKRELEASSKPTGKSKIGIHCVGEICFNDDGFVIKLPEDADPACAIKTAELILGGNSKVVFEVPGRGIVEKQRLKEELEMAKDDNNRKRD